MYPLPPPLPSHTQTATAGAATDHSKAGVSDAYNCICFIFYVIILC